MFDDFMDGANNLVDGVKENLLNARKNLEKSLIRSWVASRSYATSQTRKQVIKEMEKTYKQELKSSSTSYVESLSSAGKGLWIDKANQAVKESTNLLDQL